MFDPNLYGFCTEFYFIEKSVEVVVGSDERPSIIRIEALRDRDGNYCTRSFIQKAITVQQTYPKEHGQSIESMNVWVDYDLPWTHADSADGALASALRFLGERF